MLSLSNCVQPFQAVSVSKITNSHLQNLGIYNVETIDLQSLWPKIWNALGRVRVTAPNGTSLETSLPVGPLITASTKLKSMLGEIASATMKVPATNVAIITNTESWSLQPAVLGGLIIDQFVLTAAQYLSNHGQDRIISFELPSSAETRPVILKMDQSVVLIPSVERTGFISSSHCAGGAGSQAGRSKSLLFKLTLHLFIWLNITIIIEDKKIHFILLDATNGENTRAENAIAQVIAESLAT